MKIALITALMCGAVLVALTAATAASAPSAVRRRSLWRPKRENRQGVYDSAAVAKDMEQLEAIFQKYDMYHNSGKRSDVGGKDVKALTHQTSDGPYACQLFQRTQLLSRQGVPVYPLWEFVQKLDENGNGLLENPEMDQVTNMLGELESCMQRAA